MCWTTAPLSPGSGSLASLSPRNRPLRHLDMAKGLSGSRLRSGGVRGFCRGRSWLLPATALNCLRRKTRVEGTSSRSGVSGCRGAFFKFCEWVVDDWVALGTARPSPGRDQTGADWADGKGAVWRALVLQLARGVHLDVVFEALFCGPVVSFFATSGRGSKSLDRGVKWQRVACLRDQSWIVIVSGCGLC